METSDMGTVLNGGLTCSKSTVLEQKLDDNFNFPKISDWASFSDQFKLAMIDAISANKKSDPDGVMHGTKCPPTNARSQKSAVKTVKWTLPNQQVGSFGKKMVNIKRATFATNILVTSSLPRLPRAKLVFPFIMKSTAPDAIIAVEKAEPTVEFVDTSSQFSKDLHPRSAHELSHERANRLRREELEKYRGKYCNRLDVKFRRKPSPKSPTSAFQNRSSNTDQKLPLIILHDSSLMENSKSASQPSDTKCMNWLHEYRKYFK